MSPQDLHRNYIRNKLQHRPEFRGVVSRRVLQQQQQTLKRLGPRQSVIILHRRHYTCLTLSQDMKTCFYFDPLGTINLSKNLRCLFQSLRVETVFYNRKSVQASQSDKCGLFCMYFIVKKIYSAIQFQTFLDTFKPACDKNDQLVHLLLTHKI